MSHLQDDVFVDLLEGTLNESAVPHLVRCPACRAQLKDLRATWETAAGVDIPEPSPLFWEHLSQRVRDDIALEGSAATGTGLVDRLRTMRWSSWRLAGMAGVVAAALLAAVLLQPKDHRTPVEAMPAPVAALVPAPDEQIAVSDPDDSLGFVADLASSVDWDAAPDISLASPGAVDRSLATLNEEERVELRRLLTDALHGGV